MLQERYINSLHLYHCFFTTLSRLILFFVHGSNVCLIRVWLFRDVKIKKKDRKSVLVLKLLLHASSKDLTQWAADRFLLSFLRYSETSLPLEISLCFRGYQGTIDDLRSSLASTLFYGERTSQNTQQLQDMLRKKYESLFFASFFLHDPVLCSGE